MKSLKNLRTIALTEIYLAESGHPGGSFSCADILEVISEVFDIFNVDKFILSKGHAAPSFYALGYLKGFVSLDDIYNFRKLGSKTQGHPHAGDYSFIHTSTGSLGQGFSVAIGLAISYQYQKKSNFSIALLGDGELQEGEVWEGAMFAGHNKLKNLIAIIDYNKLQSDDFNFNIIDLEPLEEKWRAFNWDVVRCDGHNKNELSSVLSSIKAGSTKPSVIIADTVKGKGVSFMENIPVWHGSVRISDSDFIAAFIELGGTLEDAQTIVDIKQKRWKK